MRGIKARETCERKQISNSCFQRWNPPPPLILCLTSESWFVYGTESHAQAKRESQFLSKNFPGGLNSKVSGRQCSLPTLSFILLLFFAPPPSSPNTFSLKTIKPVSQMQYGCYFFFFFTCWIENHTWGIKWLAKWQWAFKNKHAGHLTKNSELSR